MPVSSDQARSLPDYRRPGPVVVLDDDSAFLEMLGMTLPEDLDLRLYTDPDRCIEFLLSQVPFIEMEAWAHRDIMDRARHGGESLVRMMLSFWAQQTERVGLAQLLVLDYNMPRGTGAAYLGKLHGWPGRRVLLTGMEDVEAVESTVHAGKIDSVIHKQMLGMSGHLVNEIRTLVSNAPNEVALAWRNALSPGQAALLGARGVAKELHALVQARCVEYVLLPKPFGVLGLDAQANIHWLQLADTTELNNLATDAVRRGLPAALVSEVRAGARLLDVDLHNAAGIDAAPTGYGAIPIGAGRRLLGAWMTLGQVPVRPPAYRDWLAANRTRAVIER